MPQQNDDLHQATVLYRSIDARVNEIKAAKTTREEKAEWVELQKWSSGIQRDQIFEGLRLAYGFDAQTLRFVHPVFSQKATDADWEEICRLTMFGRQFNHLWERICLAEQDAVDREEDPAEYAFNAWVQAFKDIHTLMSFADVPGAPHHIRKKVVGWLTAYSYSHVSLTVHKRLKDKLAEYGNAHEALRNFLPGIIEKMLDEAIMPELLGGEQLPGNTANTLDRALGPADKSLKRANVPLNEELTASPQQVEKEVEHRIMTEALTKEKNERDLEQQRGQFELMKKANLQGLNRDVMILVIKGLKQAQIAEILEMPVNTVKTHRNRANKQMKDAEKNL